jgi:hypothetical protein
MNESKSLLYKICTKCNINKLIDEFHRHKNGKFGRASKCKLCILQKNPENIQNLNQNDQIEQTIRHCEICRQIQTIDHFYENPTSSEHYMKICKECYKNRDRSRIIPLEQYFELLLRQFQRKYPRKIFDLSVSHFILLWNQQKGHCTITNHILTHERDEYGKIDTIWNCTLFLKNQSGNFHFDNIILVSHLVHTMKKKYNFTLLKIRDVYNEIIDSNQSSH